MIVIQMQTVQTHLEVMTAIATLDSPEMDLCVQVSHQNSFVELQCSTIMVRLSQPLKFIVQCQ